MFGKSNTEEELQKALSSAQITDELCSKLVHMWWDLYGKRYDVQYNADIISGAELLGKEQNKLKQNTGRILRNDHTWKFAKSLGATDETGKRVFLKATVLSILNEDGLVVYSEILPSIQHKHVMAAYCEIFSHKSKEDHSTWPVAICTDNIGADGVALLALCHEIFGADWVVDILQVFNLIFFILSHICNRNTEMIKKGFVAFLRTHHQTFVKESSTLSCSLYPPQDHLWKIVEKRD